MSSKTVPVRLKQAVAGLGRAGDLVTVNFAYARNFLLPRGIAQLVSVGEATKAAAHIATRQSQAAEDRQAIIATADGLNGRTATLQAAANEDGKLFASVQAADVATALRIDPLFRMEPIKAAGNHTVTLDFGHDILARVTVTVVPHRSSRKS